MTLVFDYCDGVPQSSPVSRMLYLSRTRCQRPSYLAPDTRTCVLYVVRPGLSSLSERRRRWPKGGVRSDPLRPSPESDAPCALYLNRGASTSYGLRIVPELLHEKILVHLPSPIRACCILPFRIVSYRSSFVGPWTCPPRLPRSDLIRLSSDFFRRSSHFPKQTIPRRGG